jgi:hypothetical protein
LELEIGLSARSWLIKDEKGLYEDAGEGRIMHAASGQDGTAQQNSERRNIDPGAKN